MNAFKWTLTAIWGLLVLIDAFLLVGDGEASPGKRFTYVLNAAVAIGLGVWMWRVLP